MLMMTMLKLMIMMMVVLKTVLLMMMTIMVMMLMAGDVDCLDDGDHDDDSCYDDNVGNGDVSR